MNCEIENLGGRILEALVVPILINLIYGFVSYMLISWPRELLRNMISRITGISKSIKNVRLLDPIRYIDPIGLLAFTFFDFGWTRSPLIDYTKAKKKDLFFFSLFGIVSSFGLFFAYGMLARYANNAILFKLFYTSAKWSLTYAFISILPIPPLDGIRMLLAFLPSKYYEWYLKYNFYGVLFMIGLLVLWILPMIMHPFVIFITNVTNFIIFGNW
ncbi:MAG TPA: site-2 protease family protein [Fervidobacterium sp.]|nr:site-2 protease family protein [Fervidobacterium sp.]HOM74607.1 site-2 protease family protein [Fervidobacterium sp.]HOQ39725.1 site-2 protease family protein [Fervidobacterium sp.]HPT54726.1 site-2 protease family protein [Fervidobacterium sp.]HPZ18138.1 site-2 protease family protein [Fervidobacterium sp.]